MLSKLIKHEWKATWKLPAVLCLFVVLMTVIGCISFYITGMEVIDTAQSSIVYTYSMIMMFIFNMLVLSTGSIVILIYFSYRFYKNLYTDEGYLMHALPVTPSQLFISKGLCASLWMLIISILSTLGVVTLILFLISSILTATGTGNISMLFDEIRKALPQIRVLFKQYAGCSLTTGVFLSLLLPVSGCLSGILLPYMCLSLGQLFKKHRVAAAVGFYFGFFFIIQLLTSLFSLPFTLKRIFNFTTYVNELDELVAPAFSTFPTYFISIIVSLALSITSFLVTRYIIGKKLNLE
ncbi:MAG TPA: hypothetical protein VJY54_10110 [Lachnospiraceae bacterium]|nr:hypothetical protein [Lachnospiraceae bacterium]